MSKYHTAENIRKVEAARRVVAERAGGAKQHGQMPGISWNNYCYTTCNAQFFAFTGFLIQDKIMADTYACFLRWCGEDSTTAQVYAAIVRHAKDFQEV